MKAFVLRSEYEDGDSFEWPRFVVLGRRADILADRMIEYAETISPSECRPQPVALEIRPFDVQNWLAMQESTEWVNEFFVAIAGALDGEECARLERVLALSGQHCILVADMHTRGTPGRVHVRGVQFGSGYRSGRSRYGLTPGRRQMARTRSAGTTPTPLPAVQGLGLNAQPSR